MNFLANPILTECYLKKKFFFIFNWRIITLQYNVGFCHTSTWISRRYTYVPSLLNLLCTCPGCHKAPGWAPVSHSEFALAIYFTHGRVYVLSNHPTLSFLYCVHKSVLYGWVSIAALQKVSSFLPNNVAVLREPVTKAVNICMWFDFLALIMKTGYENRSVYYSPQRKN